LIIVIFGETPAQCASRELLEETALVASEVEKGPWVSCIHLINPCYSLKFDPFISVFQKEGLHYITIFMKVKKFTGTVSLCEPEKCEKWEWHDPHALPSPLFLPLELLCKEYNLNDLMTS
jgi:8-oxo-dGTP diphosphatase